MNNEGPLTPDEREEVRGLYLRLHDLYPDGGYDRDARYNPDYEGRGELAALRAEVALAESAAGSGEGDQRG